MGADRKVKGQILSPPSFWPYRSRHSGGIRSCYCCCEHSSGPPASSPQETVALTDGRVAPASFPADYDVSEEGKAEPEQPRGRGAFPPGWRAAPRHLSSCAQPLTRGQPAALRAPPATPIDLISSRSCRYPTPIVTVQLEERPAGRDSCCLHVNRLLNNTQAG